jgi:diguanylate cyclase (GGDEF)-like protein
MCCQSSLYFIPSLVALLAIILLLANKLRHYFRLSETDELTSLPNFRGFRRKLKKNLHIYKQKNTDFSVAILDIDGFKRFNDHSYAFGDMVLLDFVQFLKDELPFDTFFARFRLGDEFILILPYNAEETIEKMKNIVGKSKNLVYNKDLDQMHYALTFSFGVAGFDRDNDSVETILENAERNLKENKKIKQTKKIRSGYGDTNASQ